MGKTAVLLCRLTTCGTRHKHRKHSGSRDSSHGRLLGCQTLPAAAGTRSRKQRHNNGTQAPRSLALIGKFVGELSRGCIHQHYTFFCTRGVHPTTYASMCTFNYTISSGNLFYYEKENAFIRFLVTTHRYNETRCRKSFGRLQPWLSRLLLTASTYFYQQQCRVHELCLVGRQNKSPLFLLRSTNALEHIASPASPVESAPQPNIGCYSYYVASMFSCLLL